MQTKHLSCQFKELKLAPQPIDETIPLVMEFSGYAAVFNNVDSHSDVIMPGAFKQFIADVKNGKQDWPAMMLQHGLGLTTEDMLPIGIWTDLVEDEIGLKVTGRLAETDCGEDCYTLMKMEPRPAITGLSIGYIARKFEFPSKQSDYGRKLLSIDLLEISLVTFPSNDQARISSVKSADMPLKEFEKLCRDGGFSQKEAKFIASHGFRALKSTDDGRQIANEKLFSAIRRNIEILKNQE